MSFIEELKSAAPLILFGVALGSLGYVSYHMGKFDAQKEFEKNVAIAVAQQGAKDYERLRKSQENYEVARTDLDSARSESQRLRTVLARREARVAQSASAEGNARCEKLLAESLQLLSESRERYLFCAMKHDALVDAVE